VKYEYFHKKEIAIEVIAKPLVSRASSPALSEKMRAKACVPGKAGRFCNYLYMKRSIVFLIAILYLTGIAYAQSSLGDYAREEQKRRKSIPHSMIIILKSAPPAAEDEGISTGNTENEDGFAEKREERAEKAGKYEMTDMYGKTESDWRNAMSDARNRLKQLEDEAKELASRRNALQSRHNRTNAPMRGPLRDEINRAALEQELNRKNLEQARDELQSLQKDARSSGALPGWIE
jgi:hypothetical protein